MKRNLWRGAEALAGAFLVAFAGVGMAGGEGGMGGAAKGGRLARTSPEEQGIASRAVHSFLTAADEEVNSLHSFMLVRHGVVVAEAWWAPYRPGDRHELFSLSKSFTSMAVGLAEAEGLLAVTTRVVDLVPAEFTQVLPGLPAEGRKNLERMRVSDLLTMSTGHVEEPPTAPHLASVESFLAAPVAFRPGTHFLYNTAATFMAGALVERVSGQGLKAYLEPRLFAPMGMQGAVWEETTQGVALGGYGLSLRTEDIACFGQMLLQGGQWEGRQVVPASWVERATARQTSTGSDPVSEWEQGYGYQFWRCTHGAFRGDGAMGQVCLVLPEKDTVVAVTAGTENMGLIYQLIWKHLYPALAEQSLPAAPGDLAELRAFCTGLEVPRPSGSGRGQVPSGRAGVIYSLEANALGLEAIGLEAGPEGKVAAVLLRAAGLDQRLGCSEESWVRGRAILPLRGEVAVAVTGAWVAADTFRIKVCLTEKTSALNLELRWVEEGISVSGGYHAMIRNPGPVLLTGRAP